MTVWLAISVVLVIAEILTMNLVFASFGIGALVAAAVATSIDSVGAQAFASVVVAGLTLLLVRPKVLKHLYRVDHPVGFEKLLGQEALILEIVSGQGGLVQLRGEAWTARTTSNSIPVGASVVVKSIDGATAIVESK